MTEEKDDREYLGDKVERVLKKVGADKAARAYERVTKKPCGCQKRKKAMNDWHKRQLEKSKRNRRARSRAYRQDTKSD